MVYSWLPVSRQLNLVDGGPLSLPVEYEEQVAALWRQSCERDPTLFDGRLMMVAESRGGTMILHEARYRHYLAGRVDPALGRAMGLRALGVSGVLSCPDGLVFGRRAQVADHRGMWELVPSGGAESANLKEQILKELEEEIGLGVEQAMAGDPLGLVEGDGLIDAVLPLSTSLRAAEIEEIHAERGSDEYDRLYVTMAPEEFLAACGDMVMALTRLLVKEIAQ